MLHSVLLSLVALAAFAREIEFNRDVRPILSEKCFTCHGPDAKAKNIPVRLDSEEAAKPKLDQIIQRVTAGNKALRMPPVYSGLTLSAREIETLREWIAQGGKWEKHWSLIPPVRPPLPAVKNAEWVKNPIDAFIAGRLQREGLAPSPEAGRETLLRRVTLDLTGLPPAPSEIDAFLNDKSPGAYEKVVDRLLASPRYGEKMAARWLDAARYADTNGYQYDGERQMWRWRDWVIDAFNRNEPFNQFTLEQIAGDMLPHATLAQKIATGFSRNHRGNTEDGIVPAEYAVEYVVDRVETTSAVFLGLTLGCARCHNHKYDPFTQKEFYQVYAYFDNVPERGRAMKYGNSPPLVAAPAREEQARLDDLDRRIGQDERLLRAHEAQIRKAEAAWEREVRAGEPRYWAPGRGLAAAYSFDGSLGAKAAGGEVALQPGRLGQAAVFDGKAHLDAGDVAGFDIEDPFTISAWVYSDQTPDGPVVTRMYDDPKGRGYGLMLDNGKVYAHLTSVWVSDALRLETEETVPANGWHHLAMTYTGTRLADGVAVYIDGRRAKATVQEDSLYRPYRNAGKQFKDPLRIGGGAGKARKFRGLIDDARIYRRVLSEEEIAALAVGEPVNAVAAKPAAQRSAAEKRLLRWYFLENAAPQEYRRTWADLASLAEEREKLTRSFPTVMVMAELPVPKETHLLIRGAYDKPGGKVEPAVPAVLPPLPAGAPNNRLGFAQWLIDPRNPLTARVTVNRFWQMYFGTGLVKTTEDFGVQGEWPSHPELLDWLATEFVGTGWDVKRMLKLIVTSATYRQSSKASRELVQRDPENRLLARGPRFRLPAEVVRDQALFVSGLLVEKLGGPSVKPYQPEGLWKEVGMQDMDYTQGHGEDLYRRSLYTFWKRTAAPPMMLNFDAATRESCVVRETRTNTPLQALNLMNDVTFLEAARFLGQRMMKEGGEDARSRLRYGFRLVLGRVPSAGEERVLMEDLQYHRDYFASDTDRAREFLRHGESASDAALDARELAAYASLGSLLLNMDEAITKE